MMFKWFSYGAAELESPREVDLMREAGKLVAHALRIVRQMAKPGVRTIEIDRAVEDFFHSHNAVPLFKGYPGQKVPFPASTCLSVNEQVVHGIPGQRVLKDGDPFHYLVAAHEKVAAPTNKPRITVREVMKPAPLREGCLGRTGIHGMIGC